MLRAVASILLTAAGPWLAPGQPSGSVDIAPVLTSTPFAADAGHAVTHTVALSGTGSGTVRGVWLTFTTTVALDGVAASPSRGTCPIVTATTVVCELGDVTITGAGTVPAVQITGTVHSGAASDTLVQNLVSVAPSVPDADPTNDSVSNAYLLGITASVPVPHVTPVPSRRADRTPWAVAAVAVAALLTGTGLLLLRTRRRRR